MKMDYILYILFHMYFIHKMFVNSWKNVYSNYLLNIPWWLRG